MEPPKKRNRILLLCNYCKRRKVKCDRGRPCALCLKYNVGPLCDYPDPTWLDPVVAAQPQPQGEFVVQRFLMFYPGQAPPGPPPVTANHSAPSVLAAPSQPTGNPPPSLARPNGQPGSSLAPPLPRATLGPLPQAPSPHPPSHLLPQPVPPALHPPNGTKHGLLKSEARLSPHPSPSGSSQALPESKLRFSGPKGPYPQYQGFLPQGQAPGQGHGGQIGQSGQLPGQSGQLPGQSGQLPGQSGQLGQPGQLPGQTGQLPGHPTNQAPNHTPGQAPNQTQGPQLSASQGPQGPPSQGSQGPQGPPSDASTGLSSKDHDSRAASFFHTQSTRPYPDFYGQQALAALALHSMHQAPRDLLPEQPPQPPRAPLSQPLLELQTPPLLSFGQPGLDTTTITTTAALPINPWVGDLTLDIYAHINPILAHLGREIHHAPFTWFVLTKADPWLAAMWQHISQQGEPEQKALPPPAEEEYHMRVHDSNTATDMERYPQPPSPPSNHQQRVDMNKNALKLGLTVFEGTLDKEMRLVEKIRHILPPQRAVWMLVRRFFDKVYPLVPVVDENQLYRDLYRILGPQHLVDEQFGLVNVEKRRDFLAMGILLVILRMAYLTLFTNKSTDAERVLGDPLANKDVRYLLLNPVLLEVIDMGRLCLDQLDLDGHTTFEVVQLGFMLRMYLIWAPEVDEQGDGNHFQIVDSGLIKKAMLIGLHREPLKFGPDYPRGPVACNIGRRIWWWLVILEMRALFDFCLPRTINTRQFDTYTPFYEHGNSPLTDDEFERAIPDLFARTRKLFAPFSELYHQVLDIHCPPRLGAVLERANQLELVIRDFIGPIELFLAPFDSERHLYPFFKVYDLLRFVTLKMFLTNIYFYAVLAYEAAGHWQHAFFYLRKIFAVMATEFVPHVQRLLFGTQKCMGDAMEYSVNPVLQFIVHRGNQWLWQLLARVKAQMQGLRAQADQDPELGRHYKRLSTLAALIDKMLRFLISLMLKLSHRYYRAWKLTKGHQFLLTITNSDDFYAAAFSGQYANVGSKTLPTQPFTGPEVEDLIKVAETAMAYIVSSKSDDEVAPDLATGRKILRIDGTPTLLTLQPASAPLLQMDMLDLEELRFTEDASIDKLWAQMTLMKGDDPFLAFEAPSLPEQTFWTGN